MIQRVFLAEMGDSVRSKNSLTCLVMTGGKWLAVQPQARVMVRQKASCVFLRERRINKYQ